MPFSGGSEKSICLLLAGLCGGFILGPGGIAPAEAVFVDPFKGTLAFFLLEMGLLTSRRLGDLRRVGLFLIVFGIGMPLLSGTLGTLVVWGAGLSVGGATILATLAASASYIAAPAAMRIAVPEAHPTLYLTSALGITFPYRSRAARTADWDQNLNVRIDVICEGSVASAIAEHCRTSYYPNYAMVVYVSEVQVLRPEKF